MMINEAKPPALQHVDNILEKHKFSELPKKKKKKRNNYLIIKFLHLIIFKQQ